MRRDLLFGCAIIALVLGVYWPVRNCDFIYYDDPQFITENAQVRSGLTWKTIQYAFQQPVVGNWHPITTLSHALDCEFFGVAPGPHHVVNAAIHAVNAALLFLLLQQLCLGTWPSVLIALVFAVHPLRVESVAWIAERKDVLSGFFFLLSLWLYVKYAQTVGKRTPATVWFYAGCWLAFGCGLMSKPMVVTLPFVLLLLDFWPLERIRISKPDWNTFRFGRLVLEKVPFFVLSALDCWITLAVQKHAGATAVIRDVSWTERLANATTSYVRYLGKFVWPSDLAIVYPHPAKHYFLSDAWPAWQVCAAALLLLLVSVLCSLQAKRRPYLAFGWFWFLGMMIPVIGLVQVGEQAMADRYTYLPLLGPLISLVWWIAEWLTSPLSVFAKPGPGLALGSGLILVLICLTRHQLCYWRDTAALFEHAVAVTPDNPSAQFALGVALEKQGHTRQAMVLYRVAIAIDARYLKAYYNLAQLLRKESQWQPAATAYAKAAELDPKDPAIQLNLASVLSRCGRTREAISHFERALELEPNSIEGLNNLAWLLATSPEPVFRDGPKAVLLAERGCALTQYQAPFLLGTLAAAYAEVRRFDDAIQTAERACARATEMGDLNSASRNRELLELYRSGKPYRDASP